MIVPDLKVRLQRTMECLMVEILANRKEIKRLEELDEETNAMTHAYVALAELTGDEPDDLEMRLQNTKRIHERELETC